MTHVALRVLAALLCSLAVSATSVRAQQPPATAGGDGVVAKDCSRWPASVYDDMSGGCVCPQGMWWNLRGDACLPREHAAGEFCSTVWPASSPYLTAGGGYRCVCAPPLLWDSQATACRPAVPLGEADCATEWPGTLPVLSPSGTEFECRCPGGRRWDEGQRSCVAGAPVVTRGYFSDGAAGSAPGGAAPGYTPPAAGAPDYVAPAPGAAPQGVPGYADPGVPPAAAPIPIPPPPAGSSAKCDMLLAEIRARAAAGQTAESDALGMKAAVAGCDPAAIAEAARIKN